MTDLETIKAMFEARGIQLAEATDDEDVTGDPLQPGDIMLKSNNNTGYVFFYTIFKFRADGSLYDVAAYE